ncbi:response regulator [Roseobacter sp.]|uniref:response regulator n=1 Tax=Roseobacter sp. TaxID=1907202 RepID=UPI003296CF2E
MTPCETPIDKILLVDDDTVTNLMHGRMIKRSGLIRQVDVVTDGLAALEYLQDLAAAGDPWPQLVLLDINMPRMDGFEFLEGFAALPEETRDQDTLIIMLSTSALRADHDRAEADPNVHTYMAKPINIDDISRFVTACHSDQRRPHS